MDKAIAWWIATIGIVCGIVALAWSWTPHDQFASKPEDGVYERADTLIAIDGISRAEVKADTITYFVPLKERIKCQEDALIQYYGQSMINIRPGSDEIFGPIDFECKGHGNRLLSSKTMWATFKLQKFHSKFFQIAYQLPNRPREYGGFGLPPRTSLLDAH